MRVSRSPHHATAMPIHSSSSNYQYWMLSLKMVLISTGVLSMGAFLKLSLPVAAHFLLSELPSIWASLTPPYLYLLVNCIIITILASSRLHHNLEPPASSPAPPPVSSPHLFAGYTYTPKVPDLQIHESNEHPFPKMDNNDSLILMKSAHDETPPTSNDNHKPPLSSRIRQRKLLKSSPEGKPLGVSKPKRQDTLESTWRTITEGRSMPLTRHWRKSDTWESHGRRASVAVVDPPATPPQSKVMKKSETFSGGGSPSPSPGGGGSGRVKREASLSQDELNRRVEAFIKKFNDEMRLQRQESFKQYQEMMASGPH